MPAGYLRRPKFSQAQKERAVEHYLEHGRCLSATIKALGHPSRALLAAWVREMHPETRMRVVGRSRALTPAMKQTEVIALCMRLGSAQTVARELGVSRPSLYNWKNQLLGHDAPAAMTRQPASPPSSERAELDASLTRQSVNISEKIVRRLMKQECLVAAMRTRRRYGSYMGEISPAADNLLNRDFSASAPNEKWLTDITEFQIPAGKVFLSPVIDCFDGMVVSWSIGTRPDADLVNTMLDAAIETISTTNDRPAVHSDRGGHYRWPGWLSRIAEARLARSMSRKGCSRDNAACEGFFGRLKNELFYARDWLSTTIEEFVAALDSYIRWYNEARIKISLGSCSPVERRRNLGIAA